MDTLGLDAATLVELVALFICGIVPEALWHSNDARRAIQARDVRADLNFTCRALRAHLVAVVNATRIGIEWIDPQAMAIVVTSCLSEPNEESGTRLVVPTRHVERVFVGNGTVDASSARIEDRNRRDHLDLP